MLKRSLFAVLLIMAFVLSSCAGPAAPAVVPGDKATEPAAAAEPTKAAVAVEPTKAAAAEPTAVELEVPAGYTEAPMLAELVKAGKLPEIKERLPLDPFVVGPGIYMTEENLPDWEPGKFGGTLNAAHNGTFAPDIFVAADEPLLIAPKIGVQAIKGNIVKDFKVENDNKDFTFFMRKGLKWSDGEPVTSEDVRFVWEDIYLNEKFNPHFPRPLPQWFRC